MSAAGGQQISGAVSAGATVETSAAQQAGTAADVITTGRRLRADDVSSPCLLSYMPAMPASTFSTHT